MGLCTNNCDEIITYVKLSNPLVIHNQTMPEGGLAQFAFSANRFDAYSVRMQSI